MILEQLEDKNPTVELTIHAVGCEKSEVLEVQGDDVVGSLTMDIHKRWGVTPAEQRLFHEGLLTPLDTPIRYLDNSATVIIRRPVVLKMISDLFDEYDIEVLPGDDVKSVKYDVQLRWGLRPSEQSLLIDGRPLAQNADLDSLGGGQIYVAKKQQGGGGKKASARRAAKRRSGSWMQCSARTKRCRSTNMSKKWEEWHLGTTLQALWQRRRTRSC